MSKLKFDSEFQNRILGLIIYSPQFIKAARTLISPEHFQSDEQWILCSLSFRYFDKYGTPPKQNLLNALDQHAEITSMSPESKELTQTLFHKLYPDFSAEKYYYDEIIQFSRHEDLRASLERFLPRFNTGSYDINELVRELDEIDKIHRMDYYSNNGYNVFAKLPERMARRAMRQDTEKIATLITPLDEEFKGIQARQLATVMAPSGAGKSWMLIHLAKAACYQGKHVFFFTLEMNEDDIADRFDQMLVGAESEDLSEERYVEALRRQTDQLKGLGGAFICRFLNAGTTVSKMKRYTHDMIEHYKIMPDLIVVDYGELLTSETSIRDAYIEQKEIWQAMKDMAVDMDVALWTATQTSRGGVGAKHLSELEIGDSYWKFRISDIFAGMNRYLIYDREKKKWVEYEAEGKDDRIIRFFVMKHRKSRDKYKVIFMADLKRGLFYSKKATDAYLAEKEDGRAVQDMEFDKIMESV